MTQMQWHLWDKLFKICERIENNKEELLTFNEYYLYQSVDFHKREPQVLGKEYHNTREKYEPMTLKEWEADSIEFLKYEEELTFPKENK